MCASSWFIYKDYTSMHGQQSIKLSQLVSYLFTAYSAQRCIILVSRTTYYTTPTNVADNPQLERCNQHFTYAILALTSAAVRSMCTMTQPVNFLGNNNNPVSCSRDRTDFFAISSPRRKVA